MPSTRKGRRRAVSPSEGDADASADSAIRAADVRALAAAYDRPGPVGPPPPPAGPPRPGMVNEEVTLAFATGVGPGGVVQLLPESVVMATVLCAVESERARSVSLLRGDGAETLEAVSPVYWPLPVLPAKLPGYVAIFDGAGVWRREFRYSRLPTLGRVQDLLPSDLAPIDLVARLRAMVSILRHEPVAESMTIEGFLPVDPPLLFDVLSQARFEVEPQSPHAGFLPARHPVDWYESTVESMRRSLERFEADLVELERVRTEVREMLDGTISRVDNDRHRIENEVNERARATHDEMDKEAENIHRMTREQIRSELQQIREAHSVITHAQSTVSTAEVLAERASRRGLDVSTHNARARYASEREKDARRQIREGQRRIEAIHAQERQSLTVLTERVALSEQRSAQELSSHDLFRDELLHTGSDLLDALSAQVAARTTERNSLSGYFLPLPALEQVRILWFPLWVATLRSARGIRYRVFPPMQARAAADMTSALKSLFGGILLPLEPRTVHFDSALRKTMESALASDSWFAHAMREIVRAADVTADTDFLQRLAQGLSQLRENEWITDKQAARFLDAYAGHVQQRLVGAAGPSPALPPPPPASPPGHEGAGTSPGAP